MPIPTQLHLKRGETLLASMTACDAFDMGWLACEFNPSEAFAEVAPVFEEGRRLVQAARTYNRAEDYAALDKWQNALATLGLSLIDPDDGMALEWFTLYPQSENEMQLRFGKKIPIGKQW